MMIEVREVEVGRELERSKDRRTRIEEAIVDSVRWTMISERWETRRMRQSFTMFALEEFDESFQTFSRYCRYSFRAGPNSRHCI